MVRTLLVAAVHQWTPIIATSIPALAPVAGLLLGVLAGLSPALRAARVEPVTAMR